MTMREIKDAHKQRLHDDAEEQLGLSSDRRVFQSAEGELSPLRASDATKLALGLNEAANSARADGEVITVTLKR